MGDAESAQLLTTLLRYYRENLLQQELHEAASLLADYGQQDGISFLQIGWKTEDTKKKIPMSCIFMTLLRMTASGRLSAAVAASSPKFRRDMELSSETQTEGRGGSTQGERESQGMSVVIIITNF